MRISKNQLRKKLSIAVLGVVAFTFLAVLWTFFFALAVISEIPEQRLEQIRPGEFRHYSQTSLLEGGSVVRSKDLRNYYYFSEMAQKNSFEDWIQKAQQDEGLELYDSKILIHEDTELLPLIKNDCDRVYCLQHRVEFDEIPAIFWQGLMGIEDYRFLDHFGIDFKSIARAVFVDLIEMSFVQGGSTLTQQLVKNLFYTNEKTITRKIKEMIAAIYIESNYSKESILEAYFNEVYWGSFQGIQVKGLYTAALFYFGKSLNELSSYEASILIGLLRGPHFYHPIRHFERLKQRTTVVYNRLVELGLFSEELEREWSEKRWEQWLKQVKNRAREKNFLALWHALDGLNKNEQKVFEPYEFFVFYQLAHEKLGLKKSKIENDLEVQVDLALKAVIKQIDEQKVFEFYSKPERNKKSALESQSHQVGSTLKPILYQLFLSHGYKLSDLVSVDEMTLKLKSGEWKPRELISTLNKTDKEVTLSKALLRSYNRPVIRLSKEIGFDQIERDLKDYFDIKLIGPVSEYPSQLLGALELSPWELAKIIESFIFKECEKEGSKEILDLMSDPAKGTVQYRLNRELSKMKFFGKTGTSNLGHDTWFVFFDGQRVGAIWLGNEGPRESESLEIYGSSASFPIFRDFMSYNGKRFPEFVCPNL